MDRARPAPARDPFPGIIPQRRVRATVPIVPKSFAFTVLLGLFAALPVLAIDVSAPTLALLPRALGTSQTIAGLTLSLFMAGFALGQFAGGNLSDGHGRRPVLLSGLACFTAAGFACALSASGEGLAFFRLIQGFGAGACSVIAFAMVQDLFEGEAARAKRSYVTVIFGGVPIVAPTLGVLLTDVWGWRAVHGFPAVAGALLLAVTWAGVAESRAKTGWATAGRAASVATLPGADPTALPRLREDPRFLRLALANAFSYGAIFAYIAGAPIVIMIDMGRSSKVFAAVFTCSVAAMAAGAWTSGRLSRRGAGTSALVNPGLAIAMGATLALAAVGLSGATSGVVLLPLVLVVLFMRGLVAPNLQHLAIERQRGRAGVASAAVGLSQLTAGTLASIAVAMLLPVAGPNAVAIPMALLAAAGFVTWLWAGRLGDDPPSG